MRANWPHSICSSSPAPATLEQVQDGPRRSTCAPPRMPYHIQWPNRTAPDHAHCAAAHGRRSSPSAPKPLTPSPSQSSGPSRPSRACPSSGSGRSPSPRRRRSRAPSRSSASRRRRPRPPSRPRPSRAVPGRGRRRPRGGPAPARGARDPVPAVGRHRHTRCVRCEIRTTARSPASGSFSHAAVPTACDVEASSPNHAMASRRAPADWTQSDDVAAEALGPLVEVSAPAVVALQAAEACSETQPAASRPAPVRCRARAGGRRRRPCRTASCGAPPRRRRPPRSRTTSSRIARCTLCSPACSCTILATAAYAVLRRPHAQPSSARSAMAASARAPGPRRRSRLTAVRPRVRRTLPRRRSAAARLESATIDARRSPWPTA